MDSRLENLSVQILQGLLMRGETCFDAEDYVKASVNLAELLIQECKKSKSLKIKARNRS